MAAVLVHRGGEETPEHLSVRSSSLSPLSLFTVNLLCRGEPTGLPLRCSPSNLLDTQRLTRSRTLVPGGGGAHIFKSSTWESEFEVSLVNSSRTMSSRTARSPERNLVSKCCPLQNPEP